MGELVREHAGQLIACGHCAHQAQMQSEISTGQRKGIDTAVFANHDFPRELLLLDGDITPFARSGEQRLPDALHIGTDDGIVDVVRVAVNLACDTRAEFLLSGYAHFLAVAQLRQGISGVAGVELEKRRAYY